MSSFAARLLHARSDAGLTQRELSEKTGISTVQLSRYESGKSTPRPPVLMKIAKSLGVDHEWLAGRVEKSKSGGSSEISASQSVGGDLTSSSVPKDFSLRLLKARQGHCWTVPELAEVSGLDEGLIARLEAGDELPSADNVSRLAGAMAIRLEWLANGTGNIELEDGAEVPVHPSTREVFAEIELTPDLIEFFEDYAHAHGITYEMAIQVGFRKAIQRLKDDPHVEDDPTPSRET